MTVSVSRSRKGVVNSGSYSDLALTVTISYPRLSIGWWMLNAGLLLGWRVEAMTLFVLLFYWYCQSIAVPEPHPQTK